MKHTTHQLIEIVHHNKARYDKNWFGKSQCVAIVEKVRTPGVPPVKRVSLVVNPTLKYHVTKEEFREEQADPVYAMPADRCAACESAIERVDLDAAVMTDQKAYYDETRGPGSSQRRRLLHRHRWLHGSDEGVIDNYIDRYLTFHGSSGDLDAESPLDLAYLDIEVDGVDHVGFPEETEAPCPVSLITYFYEPTSTLYQFALRNGVRDNPLIAGFEANLVAESALILGTVNAKPLADAGLLVEGENYLDTAKEAARLLGFDEDGNLVDKDAPAWAHARCRYHEASFHDTELEVIRAFFHQLNDEDRPDVLHVWNMSFDANTLVNRLWKIGADPTDEFTPAEFRPWGLVNYLADNMTTDVTVKKDIFTVMGWTRWVDQMLQYAQIRKSMGKKESYSLDYILQHEGVGGKLEIEGSIKDLAYRDYRSFMHYGALDVVPMASLEKKLLDTALTYRLAMTTSTHPSKVLRKTTCLRNLAKRFYRDQGLILSNNHNRLVDRTGPSEQFQGALVASPKELLDVGTLIGGKRSPKVFETVVDLDATSLYPSIITAFNIDAEGQLGRLTKMSPDEDPERGDADLAIAVASGDAVEMGRVWFGLPGWGELMDIVFSEEGS